MRGPGVTAAAAAAAFYSFLFRAFSVAPFGKKSRTDAKSLFVWRLQPVGATPRRWPRSGGPLACLQLAHHLRGYRCLFAAPLRVMRVQLCQAMWLQCRCVLRTQILLRVVWTHS